MQPGVNLACSLFRLDYSKPPHYYEWGRDFDYSMVGLWLAPYCQRGHKRGNCFLGLIAMAISPLLLGLMTSVRDKLYGTHINMLGQSGPALSKALLKSSVYGAPVSLIACISGGV